jgi:hypothetical protein
MVHSSIKASSRSSDGNGIVQGIHAKWLVL